MATWYVDEIGGNDSTGSGTTVAPYKTLVKVLTVLSPGDTIYGGNGLEVISSTINATILSTASTGYTRFIACTISGSVWTPYTPGSPVTAMWGINANSAGASCFSFTGASALVSFEGMEFKNATGSNLNSGAITSNQIRYIDCFSHNAGAYGFTSYSGDGSGAFFVRCKIYSNTSGGIYSYSYLRAHQCEIYLNGGYGISSLSTLGSIVKGCIIRNHTTGGIYYSANGSDICGNIIDTNPYGIVVTSVAGNNNNVNAITQNCITNSSSYGLRAGTSGQFAHEDYNYFFNNGVDISAVAGALIVSLGNSLLAQSVTPYVTPGSDFTRKQGTGLRFVDLLMSGGVVHQGITAGLPIVPRTIECIGGHQEHLGV